MKKKFYLTILILAVMLVAGFSCGGDNEATTSDEETATLGEEVESTIDDFKGALQRSEKMKCTYRGTGEATGVEATTYAEGEKYRTEYSTAGVDNVTIFDGETMYTWDQNTKKGTKMDIACLEDFETVTEDESADDEEYEEYQSSEEVLSAGVNVRCRKVLDINFEIPEDVEFIDQCAALKQQMEALEGIQEQLPNLEGLEIPEL